MLRGWLQVPERLCQQHMHSWEPAWRQLCWTHIRGAQGHQVPGLVQDRECEQAHGKLARPLACDK